MKRRSPSAKALEERQHRPRVVPDKRAKLREQAEKKRLTEGVGSSKMPSQRGGRGLC